MKHIKPPLLLLLGAIAFAACSDEPPADKIKGSYGCKVAAYTRYQKQGRYLAPNGQYRDTIYYRDTVYSYGNGSVSISRNSDKNVSVTLKNTRLGINESYESVSLSDYSYEANLSSSKDSITINSRRYEAIFSGTVNYDSKAIALSLKVKNYPSSYGKYILSFTGE